MNLLHDGTPISSEYKLVFCPFEYANHGWTGTLLYIAFQFQTQNNKRRPFLTIEIGPFCFYFGWL